MKIGVNLSFMHSKVTTGIENYAVNILKGMEALGHMEAFVIFVRRVFYEEACRIFPNAKVVPMDIPTYMQWIFKWRLRYFGQYLYVDRILMPKMVKKYDLDMMFYPFNSVTNHMSLKVPIVMTVHDLFFKNFPQYVSTKYRVYVGFRYRKLMKGPKKIIAISDYVKKDIMEYFKGIDSSKIEVIHNPVIYSVAEVEDLDMDLPYILCINTMRHHKNHITLLEAFSSIKDTIPHGLVLVGSHEETYETVQTYIHTHDLDKRVRIYTGIAEGFRNGLYAKADLFVTTSLHEGFGMTPIEAMIAGVPVISTVETSLYEVTKGLANYYEPSTCSNALAEMILEVINNPEDVSVLEEKSRILSDAYDYKAIAESYYRLFQGTVG